MNAADWSAEVPVFRIGILGGENEADRLKNYACWEEIVEKDLGVRGRTLSSGGLCWRDSRPDFRQSRSRRARIKSSYAGLYLQEPEAVEPLVTYKQVDGSTGYYSVLYVKADSPYTRR